MTDDVKLPADNASPSNIVAPAKLATPVSSNKNPTSSKGSVEEPKVVATLSDNPALAFFQKLDSKIMKLLFGKPDKYADLDKEEDVVASPAVSEQKN